MKISLVLTRDSEHHSPKVRLELHATPEDKEVGFYLTGTKRFFSVDKGELVRAVKALGE